MILASPQIVIGLLLISIGLVVTFDISFNPLQKWWQYSISEYKKLCNSPFKS